jgi:hypothetical protein
MSGKVPLLDIMQASYRPTVLLRQHIMPANVLSLLLFLLLATASCPADAWGSRGHRIIAALAAQQLTPATKSAISGLLGSDDLLAAATWADDMRAAQDNPAFWSDYANHWHFVNLPVGGNYSASLKSPSGDAVTALAAFSAILLDRPVPKGPVNTGLRHYFGATDLHAPAVKSFALKFLIHLVADLHQPLHSGYASDHGGNDIKLDWHGKPTNLHAVWDSLLLEQVPESETDYIARLSNRIQHTPPPAISRLQTTDVNLWLRESSELLERIHAHLPAGQTLNNLYATEFTTTVDDQLVKAAVRTAWYLNKLFAGQIHQ